MKVTWSPIFKRKLKALYQFIHCFKCRKNGCKAKILNKNLKVQFNAGRIHCYNFILWFLLYKIKDSLLDMLHTYSKFLVISSKSSNYLIYISLIFKRLHRLSRIHPNETAEAIN